MSIGFEQFTLVANELGLRMDPTESKFLSSRITLDGEVDSARVLVEQWVGQWVHVDFCAFIDPPADLRLSIRTAGLAAKLGELLGKHDIEVGDPAFDAAFDIKADEPARAEALLTPALRDSLLAWKKSNAQFYVTDEGVFLSVMVGGVVPSSTLDVETLVANTRALAALARSFSVALRGVPSSTILAAHVDAWRAYAATHGLEFSASPLRAWGNLGGAPFVARATAVDDHAYGVDLRLRFERPLPWLLRVRPARFFDFLERTGDAAHEATGDAEFDRELRVTTGDPAAMKALLDDGVRAALLELHRAEGDILVDSDGLSVRSKTMADPSTFGGIVDRVAIVAQTLREPGRQNRGIGRSSS